MKNETRPTREVIVTLRCFVADLPDDVRQRHASEMEMDVAELETLADVSPEFVAQQIKESVRSPGGNEMLWEGTDTFCEIIDAEVIMAVEAVKEPSDGRF